MEKQNKFSDPYVSHFSLGLICALISISLWPLFQSGLLSFYPRDSHAQIMIFGFFWSFIFGFLQTAVPRMTNSQFASPREIGIAVFLSALQIPLNILNLTLYSRILNLLQILWLIFFLVNRWRTKKQLPFEGFLFIPFALMMALIGLGILVFSPENTNLGYSLISEGLLINLIVGIGSKLLPVLLRLPQAVPPDQLGFSIHRKNIFYFLFQALFFNSNFVFQGLGFEKTSLVIKFIFLLWVAIANLRILEKSLTRTYLAMGIRISIVTLLVGYAIWILESLSSGFASQHIIFIAGLFSITLMVATRVTLAHSGAGMEKEALTPSIVLVPVLLLGASAFRYFAAANISSNGILAAFILGALAIVLWAVKVGRFLFFSKPK